MAKPPLEGQYIHSLIALASKDTDRKIKENHNDLKEHMDAIRDSLHEDISNIKNSLLLVNEKIGTKISYTHFYWIIGLIASVGAGMFYLVWERLGVVDERTASTSEIVQLINGKLDPFEFLKD